MKTKRIYARELPIRNAAGDVVATLIDARIDWDESVGEYVQTNRVRLSGVLAQLTTTIDIDPPNVAGWETEGGAL
jgi:hypothetical protein